MALNAYARVIMLRAARTSIFLSSIMLSVILHNVVVQTLQCQLCKIGHCCEHQADPLNISYLWDRQLYQIVI
jgi:hypothetical protein